MPRRHWNGLVLRSLAASRSSGLGQLKVVFVTTGASVLCAPIDQGEAGR